MRCTAQPAALRFLPGAELRTDVHQQLTPVKVAIPGYDPQLIGQAPQVAAPRTGAGWRY